MQHHFSFQRLEVYQVARQAVGIVIGRRSLWKGLPGEIGPQLERASVSIVNNIVEGAGRVSAADQRRHYQIARGSANEAAGCVDLAQLYGVDGSTCDEVLGLLSRVVQMLTVMAR